VVVSILVHGWALPVSVSIDHYFRNDLAYFACTSMLLTKR
jgi:hypothetical protein